MATRARRHLAADAWGALLQTHAALVPQLDRSLRSHSGLPLAWYDVLLELAAAPEGRLRMSALAERAVLSRTRISRVVDELVRAGLVAKEPNPDDARSSYAVITAEGRHRFEASAPHYVAEIESRFAAGLTDDELRTIARALRRTQTHQVTAGPTPADPDAVREERDRAGVASGLSGIRTSDNRSPRVGQDLPTRPPPLGP
jgi:DNA-binding MarR family transcriptional regulator